MTKNSSATPVAKTVRSSLDERAFLKNMKLMFSSSLTFIGELLQNARRAGAKHVKIETDATKRLLRFTDDGCGVSDFEALVAMCRSNWGDETKLTERPFGMGFFSTFFAGDRVVVRSLGHRIEICLADIGERRPLQVTPDRNAPEAGTVVELYGVAEQWFKGMRHSLESGFEATVARLASGFPIPVWLDGKELERPYALDAKLTPWLETSVGKVAVAPGLYDGSLRDTSLHTMLFLQGLPIGGWRPQSYERGNTSIVHLDSSRFDARMPDRAQLYDATSQQRLIDVSVHETCLKVLQEKKAAHAAQGPAGLRAFVARYWTTCISARAAYLFNDIPFMPRSLFEHANEIAPVEHRSYGAPIDATGALIKGDTVSLDDLREGRVRAVHGHPGDEQYPLRQHALILNKYNAVRVSSLQSEHWIFGLISDFEQITASVVTTDCRPLFDYNSLEYPYEKMYVVQAEKLVVRMNDSVTGLTSSVEVKDDYVLAESPAASDPELQDVTCYLTGDPHLVWSPVQALCSFTDDVDRYRSEWEENAVDAFLHQLRMARGEALFETLDHQLGWGSPLGPHQAGQVALVGVGQPNEMNWVRHRTLALDFATVRNALRAAKLTANKAVVAAVHKELCRAAIPTE